MRMANSPFDYIEVHSGATAEPILIVRWSGNYVDQGEMPLGDLGQALWGIERLTQIFIHTSRASTLSLPRRGLQQYRLQVRGIRNGSLIVDAGLYVADQTLATVVGTAGLGLLVFGWKWGTKVVSSYLKSKLRGTTFDGFVTSLESAASEEDIRIKVDRRASERVAIAVDHALTQATVPLDSAAALQEMRVAGRDVNIVLDSDGRQAILRPFAPPSLEPDSDAIIEAMVRFIRINKTTGNGLMQFVNPQDESQVGTQRFHSDDNSISSRANAYTGAFHQDSPLRVHLQRKNYGEGRHGHYWLIVGTAEAERQGMLPFPRKPSSK